ncbi:MAG TPA: hypothetical protein VFT00_02650 [Nocardioides sp.]|nr:hypothetical protein [Nocardioides sp.]
MRPRRKTPLPAAPETEDRLGRAHAFAHDDDTRPRGEDLGADHNPMTSFLAPVPLPDWLRRRLKRD